MGKTGEDKNILYRAIDVIVQMAYLNALWIGFSLAGGVILGVFPATVALYEVLRKWETDGFNKEDSTFRTFLNTYRQSFRRANLIGGILLATGGFLWMDLFIASDINHAVGFGLTFIFSILLGLLLLVVLFIFPVVTHFDKSLFHQLKYSLLIGMSSLPYAFLNVAAWAAVLSFFLFILPAAALFFASSILALVNIKIARIAFTRTEAKQLKWRDKQTGELTAQES